MVGPGQALNTQAMEAMRQRMLQQQGASDTASTSGPARQESVFYKTLLCPKWKEGRCTFGDKCTYAHGDKELRALPPEGFKLMEQRERQLKAAEAGAARSPARAGPGPPPNPPPGSGPPGGGMGPLPPGGGGMMGGMMGMGSVPMGGGAMMGGGMMGGPMGRPMGVPMLGGPMAAMLGARGMMGPGGMLGGPGMGMVGPPGMMLGPSLMGPRPPAGPPPPQLAGDAGAGVPEAARLRPKVCRQYMSSGACSYGDRCQFSHNPDDDPRGAPGLRAALAAAAAAAAAPPGPRPPPGPPPGPPPPGHPAGLARAGPQLLRSGLELPGMSDVNAAAAAAVPARERLRAQCVLLGASGATAAEVGPAAMAAASAALRSGAAFRASPYADALVL
ncbi:hypothetical protein WJX81_007005 [Elliptochloris bilobata]|uniref:C3H1-type domain-containing protein n=1 Tax=Elliptochloris bilobata TaxID=381761 RepID=A0AAW1REW6_9CHLO